MYMRKLVAGLLVLAMCWSLAACGSESASKGTTETGTDAVTELTTEAVTETLTEAASEVAIQAATGELTEAASETDEQEPVLVAYFSATGTTKEVAENIADITGGEIYEIVPAVPYTDDDLNYNNDDSRTSIEQNDSSARPEIADMLSDVEKYDIVYLGYPIWWGDAPRIICTFVEGCDLSGKTIIPFCTSGSSGIETSVSNLQQLTDGADWKTGKRFGSGSSREEVAEWIESLE